MSSGWSIFAGSLPACGVMFSATMETSVAHLVHSYVNDPVRIEVGAPTLPAEQVDLYCFEIEVRSNLGEHPKPASHDHLKTGQP